MDLWWFMDQEEDCEPRPSRLYTLMIRLALLKLDSPVAELVALQGMLGVVTSHCELRVW
jgi:hypothetical protein